jgi:hypothetical protein
VNIEIALFQAISKFESSKFKTKAPGTFVLAFIKVRCPGKIKINFSSAHHLFFSFLE